MPIKTSMSYLKLKFQPRAIIIRECFEDIGRLRKVSTKMCFKRLESVECYNSGFVDASIDDCSDSVDGDILKKDIDSLECPYDVAGNDVCMCEICQAEMRRNDEREYRLSKLKMETLKLRSSTICRNCKTRSVEILNLPCSHIVCCEPCADILDNCPLCDDRILGTVKIYLA
jgi:hypothetical protein